MTLGMTSAVAGAKGINSLHPHRFSEILPRDSVYKFFKIPMMFSRSLLIARHNNGKIY